MNIALKLLPIVNEDCAVRGITKVYFKNLTSKKVISESKRIASLELWAPDIAGIKVKKKTTKKKTTKSFAFDNIIDEQRDMLKETVEEYPAITISLADKLLRMLGLADTTSVKKL